MQRLFLTGPTASGKTALSLELARRLDAEIISMDSMAVYRRMDIGTAKPSERERSRVPHHLVDLIEPWQEFSLAEYLGAVREAERNIEGRGKSVLFVGGTPLYLTALLRGAVCGPPPDGEFRARLELEARSQGNAVLHERLAQLDPDAARRIHPNDLRRIIRALEVHAKTGTPITSTHVHFRQAAAGGSPVFCLELTRAELYRRIDRRVEAMFQAGLVNEVRGLIELEHGLSRTARQAVGYREVLQHLDGLHSLPETIALVQQRSRQFAKRQLTWFRRLTECRAVAVDSTEDPGRVADTILESLAARSVSP